MEELELREYWAILRKRWLLVILIPIIAVIVSGVLSFFVMKPQYEASTTLLVNQRQTNNPVLQYQDIMTSQALVKTYSDIMTSNTVEQAVISNLNLPYTPTQLGGMIKVSNPDQSQVIQVSVTASSQPLAAKIANSVASVFQDKAQTLMDVQNVQIVDSAATNPNASPVKPNKKLNVAIALILGLMVSVGLAFLMEYLDNRLRTEDDIRKYLNIPVLGTVVEFDPKAE
ncbi:capsular biosynthesis protein [Alicyclobacillus tolerans]|uniref:YveK family protein n=1 Tax=Alicyclobacillus tolerans TaxID=90970 RepID=UPI001F004413|nr:Wzz/FepE/Etk N-terminal domain-containing protein [Alicyclobacillus tolerans]MCF8566820.1 capsular biosynthesis protein [Alicyclobacillus tolerans]